MVFLGFQGIYAKINVFMAPSEGVKRSEAVSNIAGGEDQQLLASLGDDLRFVLIVSRATVHAGEGETRIEVTPSAHKKCERCWHWRLDVGQDADHPEICGRCVSNLFGSGEARDKA